MIEVTAAEWSVRNFERILAHLEGVGHCESVRGREGDSVRVRGGEKV